MTKNEKKELDRLFQITILEKYGHNSIISGKADLVHHFKQGRYNSIRWYVPGGIPLTQAQHNKIHSKDSKIYEDIIIAIKGRVWHEDLIRQKYKIAKDLDYNKVKSHILGEIDNYL